MLSHKDLSTLQKYCDTLTDPEIRIILDQLIHEYCQYKQSGSPKNCAQRKEWMECLMRIFGIDSTISYRTCEMKLQ